MDKKTILLKLKAVKPLILERYRIKEIGLFGSFVRGEQNLASDIDILVDFTDEADLFDLMGLTLFLEETLQHPVDVISKKALRKELTESILNQVIPI